MEEYQKEHKEKIIETPGGHLCQVYGKVENAKCSIALVATQLRIIFPVF